VAKDIRAIMKEGSSLEKVRTSPEGNNQDSRYLVQDSPLEHPECEAEVLSPISIRSL
jgi:hypothetical protein